MSPELAEQLRAARPVSSSELRERVLAVATEPAPAPRRRLEWPLRRIALVAVPVATAVALAFAGVHGIVSSGGSHQNASSPPVESAGLKAGVVPQTLQRTPALVPTTTGRL